ncbi:MAG: hypothetical protein ACTS27_00780 [Phycisphaerales bacterium]
MKDVRALAAALLAASGSALAQPTIEFLPHGYILTDLAEGGAAGAGNVIFDGSYETFRWERGGAPVRLGRDTVNAVGTGAGTPDISDDGARISATILSTDNLLTWGLWDVNDGWTQAWPPAPANVVILDNGYGSAWTISGDGQTVGGFHWGTVGTSTQARASTWTVADGIFDLEQTDNRSARVNMLNYDGTVGVGWEERADGVWRPTAWRNGAKFTLQDSLAFCEAGGVSGDGSVIVGTAYDDVAGRVAARWVWNGSSYDITILGSLPMTSPVFGEAHLSSVSDDGEFAVGFNRYLQTFAGPADGLVWTPDAGLMKAVDFIDSLGLSGAFSPDVVVKSLVAVSPDGQAFTGIGTNTRTGTLESFVIYLNSAACEGDANGDNIVNFADLNAVLSSFGQAGSDLPSDVNEDGVVNFADLNEVLSAFGATCP